MSQPRANRGLGTRLAAGWLERPAIVQALGIKVSSCNYEPSLANANPNPL